MGVVDCGVTADVLVAPSPPALSATLWSVGPFGGFILAYKAPRLVTCDLDAVIAHVGRVESNAETGQ